MCRRKRRKAGCNGEDSAATRALSRSAARKYCSRSFVPRLKKSACGANSGRANAADGTSIIMPTGTSHGGKVAPNFLDDGAEARHLLRARRSSGAMIRTGTLLRRGAEDGAQLRLQQLREIIVKPRAPIAQERVRLRRQMQVRSRFVAADIESAQRDRPALRRDGRPPT